MRIALVGPVYPYRGGIAHYTAVLAQTLRSMGHTVLVVSFKRQYPKWLFPGASDRDPSQKALRVEQVEYLLDSFCPLSWIKTALRIRDFQPHLTVISWWTIFWAVPWFVMRTVLRRVLSTPLVFVCHNVMPHEARIWDRWLTRCALSNATEYIVQSPQERTKLLDMFPGADAFVVAHPIYDMFNDDVISQMDARRLLGLPLDGKVLLFFGIVREYKGLMDLLEAMPEVIRHVGNTKLVIAGEFWEPKDRYLSRIRTLGISDAVVVFDHYIPNEDLSHYFAAADVVIAPYRHATGSGVVQMAIGFGTPLLTTLDWVFDGVEIPACYRLVPPNNSAEIAASVRDLLSRPEVRCDPEEISRLRQAFSWERLGRTLETIESRGEHQA